MQLEPTNIKALLTTATCALLGVGAGVQAAENKSDEQWQFDTALMYYGESERVTAVEGIVAAQKTFANDEVLNLKVTLDTLTGASANGAVAQPTIQSFTRPSGNGQYSVKPNNTPLDDTFRDTRLQLTGQWTQPIAQDYTWSLGGNLSKEYDYLSLAINTNVARDFNRKNTTVSVGLAFAFDMIEPEGGIPQPLSEMTISEFGTPNFDETFDRTRTASDDNKTTTDLLLGVTQVINRRMIMQFNYSYSSAKGYMTDPFKVVSVVNSQGYAQAQHYEHRPDSRAKHAFYAQAKYHFEHSIMDISYRFMSDDWNIDSHTLDFHYTIPLSSGHYIEPHVRYYTQSAAQFYQPFLLADQVLPEYISADYRIGEMNAYTLGIKYGMPLNNGDRLAFRIEYYQQTPKSNGTKSIGVLNDVELYEKVDAMIAQVTYSF